MKLYDLFSIFNLTAQKLITFPRRLTEGERATAKAQNGKTLSFSFLLYACVCVFVNVYVCKLLVSFHSFPFSFGCLSCMCFCRFLTLSTTLLHFSKDFCSCIELLACTFIDAIANAGCNAKSTAVWWEFIFILCCLFITCIYTAREKQRCQNKVSKGSNENEHDNDKWRKETRKNHAKSKYTKKTNRNKHCYQLTTPTTSTKNRNVAWIRHDSVIICSSLCFHAIPTLLIPILSFPFFLAAVVRLRSTATKQNQTKFKTLCTQEYCLGNFHHWNLLAARMNWDKCLAIQCTPLKLLFWIFIFLNMKS